MTDIDNALQEAVTTADLNKFKQLIGPEIETLVANALRFALPQAVGNQQTMTTLIGQWATDTFLAMCKLNGIEASYAQAAFFVGIQMGMYPIVDIALQACTENDIDVNIVFGR